MILGGRFVGIIWDLGGRWRSRIEALRDEVSFFWLAVSVRRSFLSKASIICELEAKDRIT